MTNVYFVRGDPVKKGHFVSQLTPIFTPTMRILKTSIERISTDSESNLEKYTSGRQ
jgi:hypothetical protein